MMAANIRTPAQALVLVLAVGLGVIGTSQRLQRKYHHHQQPSPVVQALHGQTPQGRRSAPQAPSGAAQSWSLPDVPNPLTWSPALLAGAVGGGIACFGLAGAWMLWRQDEHDDPQDEEEPSVTA